MKIKKIFFIEKGQNKIVMNVISIISLSKAYVQQFFQEIDFECQQLTTDIIDFQQCNKICYRIV